MLKRLNIQFNSKILFKIVDDSLRVYSSLSIHQIKTLPISVGWWVIVWTALDCTGAPNAPECCVVLLILLYSENPGGNVISICIRNSFHNDMLAVTWPEAATSVK